MNPFSQFFTATDHFTIIPAVMLALFGCAILLFDAFDAFFFAGPAAAGWLLLFVVLARESAPAWVCTGSNCTWRPRHGLISRLSAARSRWMVSASSSTGSSWSRR